MVTLGTYLLAELQFNGREVGLIYGTTAIAATVSPFWLGVLADRFFSTERLLAILHLLGGILFFVVSLAESFTQVYVGMIAYTLAYLPTFSLANTLSFHHLPEPARQFPQIRVWGTIAWVIAGIMLSYFSLEKTVLPIRISAAVSILQGLYCFTLPKTPPQGQPIKSLADLQQGELRTLLADRNFLVLILALLLICLPASYYYSFVNPFLNEIGVANAAGKMTLGQVVEVLVLLALPWFFRHWAFRWIIFLGLFAWGIRYIAFAYAETSIGTGLIYFGIAVQGFAYGFTALAAQIWVDKQVSRSLRGTAQGFISLLTLGIGAFLGTYIAGETVSQFTLTDSEHQWTNIWLIPGFMGMAVAFGFLLLFRPQPQRVF